MTRDEIEKAASRFEERGAYYLEIVIFALEMVRRAKDEDRELALLHSTHTEPHVVKCPFLIAEQIKRSKP
jgi:hypothetical protein